nr:PREDICTED: uncharacterized protein LOC106704024 [Latimeria chalumnae]|eukprot:XP_014345642.1 PREDICTED: uncharacterized protein LOC106704024 [Latimeria chalumnae]
MPRHVKTLEQYARDHKDFVVEDNKGKKVLVCTYCRVTIHIVSGKTATRLTEHMESKTHINLKNPPSKPGASSATTQLSINETMKRFKRKREEEMDVTHEFTRALAQSGICLSQADGPIGSVFCKRAAAAKTMPKAAQLYSKYLPEGFESDLEHIKELVRDVQISITVDETPEIHGDPAVAVLFTFYKDSQNVRYTVMADLEVLESCNAISVSALIQQVLDKFEKRWEDVV